MAKQPKPLSYKSLRPIVTLSQLKFKTTKKIKLLTNFIGQKRAVEALKFGIGVKSRGYNLYAMGPSGVGKRSLVRTVLNQFAKKQPTPADWCYIHNFDNPQKPIPLKLPAGMGIVLQKDMNSLVDELSSSILTVFESDEYHLEMQLIQKRSEKKRGQIRQKINCDKVPYLYKERHEKEKSLQTKLTSSVVKPIINRLKQKYKDFPEIIRFLSAVQTDIIKNVNELVKYDEKLDAFNFSLDSPILIQYRVNVLVDNSHLKGAPVIFEEIPCYSNLISRIEHTSQQGTLVTNFTLIRAGNLHRANGGYLVIEARKLKHNKEAWEALKIALYTCKIKIEPFEFAADLVKPVSLEPISIPLNVKVILLGSRNNYYSLCDDPDFVELFKVPVDFDEQINRNKVNMQLYVRLISTIIKRDHLIPFRASAVASIIDYSSRLAEDIEKLSTHVRDIEDLIIESAYWASSANKKIVEKTDVEYALQAQVNRMDRARQLYYEDIYRKYIVINTSGSSLGQVNCLSVRRVGNYSYGHPTRVTARVRLGKGKLIDIQREIKMAGPLHSKAGLIIANFLASRFSPDQVFSLSASIAFEQIYVWTDGDSASVGELCALLSALAEIPIYQFFAVTGSIDQYGEVQAIGNPNEKIEGFFDVCAAKGLTGKQGVLLPAVNIKNLILRKDVVAAVKEKKFVIYPIQTIDEAISLLTGHPAGERNKKGNFTKDSIYYRIENRLQKFAKTSQKIRIKKD